MKISQVSNCKTKIQRFVISFEIDCKITHIFLFCKKYFVHIAEKW